MQIDIAAMQGPEGTCIYNALSTSTIPIIALPWILTTTPMLEFWLARTFAMFRLLLMSLLECFKNWLRKMFHADEKDGTPISSK